MAAETDDFPRVLAMYDYVARTDQELTFRAGDMLIVTEILSDDWFEGQGEGSVGLIAAAYVKHVADWRSIAAVKKPSPVPSPQLTRRKVDKSPPVVRVASTRSPPSSPLTTRKSMGSPAVGRAAAVAAAARATPPDAGAAAGGAAVAPEPLVHGRALPGMGGPDQTYKMGSIFRPGATDDELIQPKAIPMQPDRPDLAKALQIRNQAARVGAPMKTGPNELARHLAQLKTKAMYKGRTEDDAATAELKARLKQQSVRNASKAKSQEQTELQMRMATIAQQRQ
mmetsp:Transcript_18971/g.49356  ORF Transcript_18971/g.49356 Transcript_18971/m.49356 type:complete len:282 (+) Transcript_18971:34-879(+)|eukprot:CAMPEP_0182926472 /NCGR_PEP_ID=MMETSP0105_2-20130417/12100_1 /TAXON_ID=81532 ORGANISM="Acanthoeca-like sp., Strain 10tr" /NCGR_SAMPLE_ID=MMETSP0105_2 /ASSEMBLY_ACC=CAM_ASM_000205 /LENGTH=281 /DNA_ID=CAMNT_0025064369 /DNA_START=34 /DNA_END=879 /DNA_ORIENTATION=-